MIRRSFVALSLLCFMGSPPLARPSSAEESPSKPPNLLFLFADDYSFEAIGSLGLVDVETPNIDRLYARGTRFTRAYNMGGWNGAICVASRCMLMTGRTLWDAHSIHDSTDAERQAGRFWPSLLKTAGYETFMTGKWHVNTDAEAAFDVARHVRPGMPNQTVEGYNRPLPGRPDPWDPTDHRFGGFWAGGTHWSEVTADDAIGFLKHAAGTKSPFFMYVAFNAPHDPRQSPAEYLDRYPTDRIALPSNYLPEYPFKDDIGCGPVLRDEALAPFPRSEKAVKVHRSEYFALITHLDHQIGRILDELEACGEADDTVVVFTADHGLAVGHHGFLGKQNLYEHSVRVPFVVAGPGIAPQRRIDAPIYLHDIMPTTLQLAGVPIPEHVGFSSLLPILRGEADGPIHPSIYGAYMDLQRSVILDDHKLILYPGPRVARLYHLLDDPEERMDLAEDPSQAERLATLYAELLRLQDLLGDPLDLRASFGDTLPVGGG
jgi:choline-sulfatase